MKKIEIRTFLILLLISTLFCYSLTKIKIGENTDSQFVIYSIRFDYFGIDPIKLEKLITIPLEDRITELDGVYEIKSTIQFNKTVTTVFFNKNVNQNSTYQNLTQITDDIYLSLPSNVQKPQIISSDSDQKPYICISFDADKNYIERNIKPIFDSIDGITESFITGGINDVININYNPELLTARSLLAFDISESINNSNCDNVYCSSIENNYVSNLFFNNAPTKISELKKTAFPQNDIQLDNLCNFNIDEEETNELVLLNNKKTVYLNLKTSSDANLISISNKCKKILNLKETANLSPEMIYDFGSIQKKELMTSFYTLIITILISSVLIYIFFRNIQILVLSFIQISLTILWTISSFPLYNQFIMPLLNYITRQNIYSELILNSASLSGLSLSTGLITDVLLVFFESFNNSQSIQIFHKDLKTLKKSSFTSTLTTVIAVIPLFFANSYISGTSTTAITIILMLIYSLIISVFFLTVFFNKSQSQKINFIKQKIKIKPFHFNKKNQILFFTLAILSIIIFTFSKKNIEPQNDSKIIYAKLYFNPEKQNTQIQKETLPLINSIKEIEQVKYIKSEFSRGHAELEIVYDKISENKLTQIIRSKLQLVPEAYIYISETSQSKKDKPLSLQFTITGDSESECRKIAKQAAETVSQNKYILQTVLNFSEEEKMLLFIPDQKILSKNHITVEQISELLRYNIFSPVISKYLINLKETDIKLKNINQPTLKTLNQFKIYDSLPLSSLGNIVETTIPSKLYRYNCRPCASFSIEIKKNKLTDASKEIKKLLKSLNINNNYFINFPQQIINANNTYTLLYISILFCLTCIYIFLTSLNENPALSFFILLTIPASLFLPLSIRIITNTSLNFGDFIGIILLSGIVINNSIYISESQEFSVQKKLESKLDSIIITSSTTILSSLPMLLFSNSPFIKSMSFFMFFGTLSSIFVSLILFPNFICKLKKMADTDYNHHCLSSN